MEGSNKTLALNFCTTKLLCSGVRTSNLRVPNEFEHMIFAECEFRTSLSFHDVNRTDHP